MIKSGLLSLLGLLLGLAATEVLVRISNPSYANGVRMFDLVESERGRFCRYDETLGWDGIPEAHGDFEYIDCKFKVRQNPFGYRSQAYDLARSKNERIVALGDSFVWGFGVDDEDIFTRLVEKKSVPTVEIVNMGVSGYGTDQELLLWNQKAHKWKPDQVWLAFNIWTDLFDISGPKRYGYEKPFFGIDSKNQMTLFNVPVPTGQQPWSYPASPVHMPRNTWAQLERHSALACLVFSALSQKPAWRAYLEKKHMVLPLLAGEGGDTPIYQVPYDAYMEGLWTLLDRIVGSLAEKVAGQGGHLTLLLEPTVVQVYPEIWTKFVNRSTLPPGKHWDLDAPSRRFKEIAQAHHIEVIDLLPDLREAGKTDANLYFPFNMHWTRAGHRVVASTLLAHLRQKTTPP